MGFAKSIDRTVQSARGVALLAGALAFVAPGQAWAQPDATTAPELIQRVDPVYPPAETGKSAEVVLLLTLDDKGAVTEVTVAVSGGAEFDKAASEAVRQWRFRPATRGGQAVASRIRVPMTFAPAPPPPPVQITPASPQPPGAPASPGTAPGSAAQQEPPPEPPPTSSPAFPKGYLEVKVAGERRPQATSTSEYQIPVGQLRVIPRKSATEFMMLAPGVLTTNHGGEGHAHETYIRGFASKEGQDIEYTVDGVPVNDVSNPHGHGYADLYFMPPEFVRSVKITSGPFDPSQGDFAFAGSANYQLGVDERGSRVSYGFGSFGTHRMLLSYAPKESHRDTFAGFELYRSNGFGTNRAAQRALGLGRYGGVWEGSGTTWHITAFGYAARFDQPGVVRQDDYEAKRMGFFDTYDPNQGGESSRMLVSFDTISGAADRRFRQTTWAGLRAMRLRVNFTGWLTDVAVTADGEKMVQRGDGLEMRYASTTAGSRGSYDLVSRFWSRPQNLSLGYSVRYDEGDSSQLRIRSVTAIPYNRVFDDRFRVANLAGWVRGQLRPADWLTVRGGVRIDAFSFGVMALDEPIADREGSREPTQTSQSFGFAASPRATLDVRVAPSLHAVTSYGIGTRSTEAAALSDNETAPFAKAQVAEAGLVHQAGSRERFSARSQLSYVFTHVDRDMLFDPVAGRNIFTSSAGSSNPVGPSTRHAVLASSRASYANTLDALLNIGWARGTLDSTGELLPYIPQLIARIDTSVHGPLFGWRLGHTPVIGRAGVGFTYVPGRPLPYKAFGDPYYLLNLGGDVRLGFASVGIELRNLLNLQYRQSEFNYASNFRGPEAIISQRPIRHFTAGEPLFAMATLTIHLEDLLGSKAAEPIPGEKPPVAEDAEQK